MCKAEQKRGKNERQGDVEMYFISFSTMWFDKHVYVLLPQYCECMDKKLYDTAKVNKI